MARPSLLDEEVKIRYKPTKKQQAGSQNKTFEDYITLNVKTTGKELSVDFKHMEAVPTRTQ